MSTNTKPRICEVLGVEVGEVFLARMESGECRRFVAHGIRLHHVWADGSTGNRANNMSLWLLEHPEAIIRKSRFTEDEVATMRVLYAAGARYIVRNAVTTCWFTEKPTWREELSMFLMPTGVKYQCGDFPLNSFRCLTPGQSVTIEDILKNENETEK